LIAWSDSCAGQSKNFTIVCLWQLLILKPWKLVHLKSSDDETEPHIDLASLLKPVKANAVDSKNLADLHKLLCFVPSTYQSYYLSLIANATSCNTVTGNGDDAEGGTIVPTCAATSEGCSTGSTLRSKKGKLSHDSKDGSQPGRQTGRVVPKVKTGTKQAVEDQASSSSVASGILCQKKQQQSAELQKKKSLTGNVRKRTANTRCTTDVKKKRKTD